MTAERGPSADESASTSNVKQPSSETSPQRRRQLQQKCLEPSGFDQQSLQEAWLFLLGITEDHIQAHIVTQQEEKAHEEVDGNNGTEIADESELSSIPLDKDGWQVADENILNGESSRRESSTAAPDAGWKVVQSKKSRRRRGDESASTSSAPNSPDLSETKPHSSPDTLLESSPDSSTSPDPHVEPEPPNANTPTRQPAPPRYPNLSARDLEQVAKDVERSFVGPAFKHLFPCSDDKDQRRAQLSSLILTTLSRHPALHYFQGYHDILSVLLLSLSPRLPPSARETAILELTAARLSLHLIRDSMTRDLLPIMGQLKLVSHLLHACDPDLAELVDVASPLPFFALPWLLTLLTHDVRGLAVMQRVVGFVLAYGPAAVVYLCAAVLRVRKGELAEMEVEEREDPAMLHAVLGRLPVIREGKGEEEVEEGAIYSDPDVELPSLAADRKVVEKEDGVEISQLLQQTVELMHRYPLSTLKADTIMGPKSVIFTWPSLFTPTEPDWESATDAAIAALTGPTEAVVKDPHPPSPPHDSETDEKQPASKHKAAPIDQARMLAIVGISGLLVAALVTASQNPRGVATDETKKVLTLIVSLLSSWGRVVGGSQ